MKRVGPVVVTRLTSQVVERVDDGRGDDVAAATPRARRSHSGRLFLLRRNSKRSEVFDAMMPWQVKTQVVEEFEKILSHRRRKAAKEMPENMPSKSSIKQTYCIFPLRKHRVVGRLIDSVVV